MFKVTNLSLSVDIVLLIALFTTKWALLIAWFNELMVTIAVISIDFNVIYYVVFFTIIIFCFY